MLRAEDEGVPATLPKGAPRSFRTAFSLAEPGTEAPFRVDAILGSGSEGTSEPVTVRRPGTWPPPANTGPLGHPPALPTWQSLHGGLKGIPWTEKPEKQRSVPHLS
jgi:hypothetical protein